MPNLPEPCAGFRIGEGRLKGHPDIFPPSTFTNVGISNQNVLIFRINPFAATLA